MENQEEVWNNIAPEWSEFKTRKAEYIEEFLRKQKGNILDLGCGTGRHLEKIKEGKMHLVDFSEGMIKLAKLNAKKKKIEAEFKISKGDKIPYEDNFFDGAICHAMLHCVETEKERKSTIKELFRVLKPGAEAMIGVWNKSAHRFERGPKEKMIAWRDKGKRYYYLYEEDEIHKQFKEAGFKIKPIMSKIEIAFIAEKPKN